MPPAPFVSIFPDTEKPNGVFWIVSFDMLSQMLKHGLNVGIFEIVRLILVSQGDEIHRR